MISSREINQPIFFPTNNPSNVTTSYCASLNVRIEAEGFIVTDEGGKAMGTAAFDDSNTRHAVSVCRCAVNSTVRSSRTCGKRCGIRRWFVGNVGRRSIVFAAQVVWRSKSRKPNGLFYRRLIAALIVSNRAFTGEMMSGSWRQSASAGLQRTIGTSTLISRWSTTALTLCL